jgi:hypothetical protein
MGETPVRRAPTRIAVSTVEHNATHSESTNRAAIPRTRPGCKWFSIAAVSIPLGFVLSFLGLAIGLGVGSSAKESDDWMAPIAVLLIFIGYTLTATGALLLAVLLLVWFVRFIASPPPERGRRDR